MTDECLVDGVCHEYVWYVPVLVRSNSIPETSALPQSNEPHIPPHKRDDPRLEGCVENLITNDYVDILSKEEFGF